MRRFLDRLYYASGAFAALCIAAIFALMLAQSFGREAGILIRGAEDIVAWLCAASAFFALGHTFRHGELVRVGLWLDMLGARGRWLAELLGASPTVVQVPDVPQLFATGGIQAMITSSATGTATKAWEFVKNYYNTSAFHPKNAVVVNTRSLLRLPKNEQQALRTSGASAEKRGWDMAKEREKEANETLAKNGMTLHEPDGAMKSAYAKVGDQILAEWLKKAGPEGDQLIKAYRSGK